MRIAHPCVYARWRFRLPQCFLSGFPRGRIAGCGRSRYEWQWHRAKRRRPAWWPRHYRALPDAHGDAGLGEEPMKRIVTTAALVVLAVTAATASPSGEIDPIWHRRSTPYHFSTTPFRSAMGIWTWQRSQPRATCQSQGGTVAAIQDRVVTDGHEAPSAPRNIAKPPGVSAFRGANWGQPCQKMRESCARGLTRFSGRITAYYGPRQPV